MINYVYREFFFIGTQSHNFLNLLIVVLWSKPPNLINMFYYTNITQQFK